MGWIWQGMGFRAGEQPSQHHGRSWSGDVVHSSAEHGHRGSGCAWLPAALGNLQRREATARLRRQTPRDTDGKLPEIPGRIRRWHCRGSTARCFAQLATGVLKFPFSCSPPACFPRRGRRAGKQPSSAKQQLRKLGVGNRGSWLLPDHTWFLRDHLNRVLGKDTPALPPAGARLCSAKPLIRDISYYYTLQYEKQSKETTTTTKR